MKDLEERAKKFGESRCNDCVLVCSDWRNDNVGCIKKYSSYSLYKHIAEEQHKIEIDKLKSILNTLMIDTHDKAEIIKMMER